MFGRIWAWMNRHAGLVIFAMAVIIVGCAIGTTGLFSDDRKDRYDQLMDTFAFVVDEENGMATWDTEEEWKDGMNQMMDLCPKELFQNNPLYGDNEVLRQMLRNTRRVKFDDKNREEMVELIMELKIEDNSKWGMYRCKVDDKQVKEINYLTGIRMIY